MESTGSMVSAKTSVRRPIKWTIEWTIDGLEGIGGDPENAPRFFSGPIGIRTFVQRLGSNLCFNMTFFIGNSDGRRKGLLATYHLQLVQMESKMEKWDDGSMSCSSVPVLLKENTGFENLLELQRKQLTLEVPSTEIKKDKVIFKAEFAFTVSEVGRLLNLPFATENDIANLQKEFAIGIQEMLSLTVEEGNCRTRLELDMTTKITSLLGRFKRLEDLDNYILWCDYEILERGKQLDDYDIPNGSILKLKRADERVLDVTVRPFDGGRVYKYRMPAKCTISDVKMKIEEETDFSSEEQSLTYLGSEEVLEDDKVVADLGLRKGFDIFLVVKLPGRMGYNLI